MIVDREQFFSIQSGMNVIPYKQSRGWHDYQIFLKECEIAYYVDDLVQPHICAWGLERNIPFIGKILLIEGKSHSNILNKKQIKEFYEDIAESTKYKYKLILISDLDLYDVNFEIGIRQAGYVRSMFALTCPLSIVIDLQAELRSSRIWKRGVKDAMKQNLIFEQIKEPDKSHISFICKTYQEMFENKGEHRVLNVNGIAALLENKDFKLFIVTTADKIPLAARIIYVNNGYSYDLFAANSLESRKVRGSTYYMVEQIFSWLRDNNINSFDFGRIGPAKRSTNSVYEFKNYSGGKVVQYNGEWSFVHSKVFDVLFSAALHFKTWRW